MKCPFCQHPNTQVTDSRLLEETNSIRRRRRCSECGQRFSTFETVEMRMPQVTKTNGARVAFNPHKLHTSLSRALHKRPVSPETIDETVALIEQRLYQLGRKEVPSKLVGEMAMEELAKIDQVAYVRFASVYKSFNDVYRIYPSHRHPAERPPGGIGNRLPRRNMTGETRIVYICRSFVRPDRLQQNRRPAHASPPLHLPPPLPKMRPPPPKIPFKP